VVFVKAVGPSDGHALLVEKCDAAYVAVRDPLPEGAGKAYRVPLNDFIRVWLSPESHRGSAAVVVESPP
jgi:hypothetical protein